jgi:site-specific recombinase XerD
MEYLEVEEVKAILQSIDKATPTGKRDHLLISLLYNTGARVQEICDLRGEDVHKSPPSVILTGKGRKTRQVPLWPEVATALREYLQDREPSEKIFQNARGMPLTRFGAHHIIGRRVKTAAKSCPSLKNKKTVTPHTFRHTTAMHLLQSGVELTVIKSWLGHVHITTTHGYIEIDLKMKQKALAQCKPLGEGNKLEELIRKNGDVITWLNSL